MSHDLVSHDLVSHDLVSHDLVSHDLVSDDLVTGPQTLACESPYVCEPSRLKNIVNIFVNRFQKHKTPESLFSESTPGVIFGLSEMQAFHPV